MSTVGHHSGWTNICPQDKRPLVRGGAFVRGRADVLPSHSERGPRQVCGILTRTFSPQVVKIVLQIWQERKINLRLALKRESLSCGGIYPSSQIVWICLFFSWPVFWVVVWAADRGASVNRIRFFEPLDPPPPRRLVTVVVSPMSLILYRCTHAADCGAYGRHWSHAVGGGVVFIARARNFILRRPAAGGEVRPPAIVGRYRDDVTDDEITAGAGDGDANCRKGPAHRLGCGRLPPSTPAHLEADRTHRLSPNAGRDTPAMRGFPTLRSTVCPLFRRRLGGLLHPASYINLYCYYYNHLTASFPGQPG